MATSPRQVAEDLAQSPQRIGDALGLVWDKLNDWLHAFILLLPNLVAALLVGLLGLAAAYGAAHLMQRAVERGGRRDLGYVLGRLLFWFLLLFDALVVMTIVLPSMQPVDIFASLGIGSIAVGFAFKDVLQNLLAGLLILIRRPFKRGDQIKIGDIEGTVQAVETRATLVKTYSGRLVIIPNSDIYTRSVTVNTAYDIRRVDIVVPVGLEVDLAQAIEVFKTALASVEDILGDPEPDVLPWEFKDNNVDIVVRWWTKSQRAYEVKTRAQAIQAIKTCCEAAGIAIPADTKISFAQPEFVVALKKEAAQKRNAKPEPEKTPPELAEAAAPRLTAIEIDEKNDPEAATPEEGELNEAKEELPR